MPTALIINVAVNPKKAPVRVRDVSLQTKTQAGTKAKDTFLHQMQTAKKLGINIYEYIYDRISGQFKLPCVGTTH